ncbi:MAG: hypothetical protein HY532_04585, partial [Chloroflexi bacterium]|nr:hypothetical protein [Chloroflexota bacterium]
DGGLPAGLVTLAWAGDGEELHTVVYFVADGELIRDYDGVQMAVARHVVSAGFSLSGSTLRLEIEVLGAHGATEWAMLDTYLRMLQP